MRLREKLKLTAPDEFFGRVCFPAWKELGRQFSPEDRHSRESQLSPARFIDQPPLSPELRGLVGALQVIRQRIFANSLLRSGMKWVTWLMIGLIAVALAIANFGGAVIFVAALAGVAVVAILIWTWRNRPSNYETARRLDAAACLQDRLSTAVYLGGVDAPEGMIGEQRRDAISRLAKVDPRVFFPVEIPGNLRRAVGLVLIVTGLLAYRIHHRPPLISLLQTTARSQLVQSILSPLAHAMEKDLQRTIALVAQKPIAPRDETERADAASNSDDLWKSDDRGPGSEDQKDAADAGAGDQDQDQMQAPDSQDGNPTGDARQDDSYSQSQDGKNDDKSSTGKSQQPSEQQGPEGRQSLGQSLMQALKNMMSNSPSQQSNNRAAQQPPNGQGNPQSGNSQQPGATESDKRGESRGNSDAKQKATQTASEGAGSQQGSKELNKNLESHPVTAIPDRVALESAGYKEQTRMKIATETGSAQLADRGLLPQQDAVINGAEQENIPARYRFYVQHYFEHADGGKQ